MRRVFVDTSVLYSAIKSDKGYARDLLQLAANKRVIIVVHPHVLNEIERNLAHKSPHLLPVYYAFMARMQPEIVTGITRDDIKPVQEYVVKKDVIVVAAAIKSNVDYLVTYDRKHILREDVIEKSALMIALPKDVVTMIQSEEDT